MKTTWMRAGAVGTLCAIAGAGAGIAGSSAATGKTRQAKAAAAAAAARPGLRHDGRRGRGPGFGRGPVVHAEVVVLDKAGTGYITQTLDDGLVKSVSGNDLVVTEGTKAVPYKDASIAVPSGATIMRNGRTAQLSDLKAGDHVHVAASSEGTMVFAGDDPFGPRGGPHRHGDHDDDGPPGPPPAPAPGTPGR